MIRCYGCDRFTAHAQRYFVGDSTAWLCPPCIGEQDQRDDEERAFGDDE